MRRVIAFLVVLTACWVPTYSRDNVGTTDSMAALQTLTADNAPLIFEPPREHTVLTAADLRPAVFDRYYLIDTVSVATPFPGDSLYKDAAFNWIDDAVWQQYIVRRIRQNFMINYPDLVKYNEQLLPEPPRRWHMELDPQTAKLHFVEDVPRLPDKIEAPLDIIAGDIGRRHWIRNANAGLQFTQAYVSPNWYQGGSNNLTMMLDLGYNVKLNPKFHPNLLCEMSVGYKLSVHGTPEDSLRNYNISEDLFQFNGKLGYKAWRNWFYSLTGMVKTQFFKNYEVNSPSLKAAFLSPVEINMGIGMTWEHINPRKTFQVNASLSPLSWNMKGCNYTRVNVADFGISPGHKAVHKLGSSGELKMVWNITWNISYTTRLFAFTDYRFAQGDWENTFNFAINRFLSTQLYVHLRYDSRTSRPSQDSNWHLWQLKEILSFGFSYKFAMP